MSADGRAEEKPLPKVSEGTTSKKAWGSAHRAKIKNKKSEPKVSEK
jgi:hypothetical protein